MSGRDYQVPVCKQFERVGEKQQGEVKMALAWRPGVLGFDFGRYLTVLSLSLLICVTWA